MLSDNQIVVVVLVLLAVAAVGGFIYEKHLKNVDKDKGGGNYEIEREIPLPVTRNDRSCEEYAKQVSRNLANPYMYTKAYKECREKPDANNPALLIARDGFPLAANSAAYNMGGPRINYF